MLFNSILFILFFLVVVTLYYLLPQRHRWLLLLVASYVFYMNWSWPYVFLLLASTVVNFFLSHKLQGAKNKSSKKKYLVIGVVFNLLLLCYFKYAYFIADTFAGFGLGSGLSWSIILPIGISFYTFQAMSYLIDVYKEKIKAEKNIGHFALYISFFPQLIAGPIERADHLLPQIKTAHKFSHDNLKKGLVIFLYGLVKKVVIADSLAIYINNAYGTAEHQGGAVLLIATYAFAIQIYCDFSGYSDMAIGLARMLGFKFMDNFNTPYFSKTVTEFWRRWHISLSSWLKEYLYFPLGGSRDGKIFTLRNLMITMLIAGLWHGPTWVFVFWGGIHGLLLVIERITGLSKKHVKSVWVRILQIFLTFNLVCFSWIFFRANSWQNAMEVIRGIFTRFDISRLGPVKETFFLAGITYSVLLFIADLVGRKNGDFRHYIENKSDYWLIACAVFCILSILLFGIQEGDQFIYFQF